MSGIDIRVQGTNYTVQGEDIEPWGVDQEHKEVAEEAGQDLEGLLYRSALLRQGLQVQRLLIK